MKRATCLVPLLLLLLTSWLSAQVSFFQPPTYAGSGNVFVADFNGDGKPDLLSSDGTLQLGNGNGTFTTGTPVTGGALAVADFNGDGKPDVLQQGTGTLLVLLGNGNGTFQTPISTPSGASLGPIAVGNLTGNQYADVVGVFNGSLLVYIGKGDGTFASGVSYNLSLPTGSQVTSVILGDVNGDGKTDVTLITQGDNVAGQVIVFLGNGDGTLQTPPKTSAGVAVALVFPLPAVEGDFNGDGKPDLLINVGQICNGTCTGSNNISFLAGNGDGTFQAPVSVISANGPLAAADLNGDGKLDLVVEGGPNAADIYLGNGDGTFSNASNYILGPPGNYSTGGIAIADFNLDGKLDLALGNVVLLGNGDGTFQGVPLGVVPSSPGASAIGDFENDGKPDVAVLSNEQIGTQYFYNVYILRNNGSGALSLINTYQLQQPGYGIVTADFNGDGNLDLVVFGTDPIVSEWSYSVLLGNGDGSFQPPVFYPQNVQTGTQSYSIVIADFNGDGKPDIAAALGGGAAENQTLVVLLGNGNGTFAAPVYYFDEGGAYLVTADFNGDGKADLASGVSVGSPQTAILFGNGDGTFQPAVFPASLNNFGAEFTADLRNIGKADLVAQDGVALGNGDGTFNVLPGPLATCWLGIYCPVVQFVGDFNGDGIPDLFISESSSSPLASGVLLGNGDGTFSPLIQIPTNAFIPSFPLVADMNGDGRPDIVFSFQAYNSPTPTVAGIGVLLNTTAPSFAISASPLSPQTVTTGTSAVSTVTVKPTFGFNGAVVLSCTGLPSGASCGFSPSSIANSSGTSTLTITTSSSTAAGTYSVKISGTSGSLVESTTASLVVQAAPDFTIGAASGSPTSQTINAGQSSTFSLVIAPSGSFSGTVNLSCNISPTATPAPSCSLSSSSVQIASNTSQTVTVTVKTTAPVTTGSISEINFPSGGMPFVWMAMLMSAGWLVLYGRKRLPTLAAPIVVLAFVWWIGCGGGGGSSLSPQTTTGTLAGTYTATITATSGNLSHSTTLTVKVQ